MADTRLVRGSTKRIPMLGGLVAGLLFAILAVPLGAQTTRTIRPYYDISKEVTLTGTVMSVLKAPSPGMIAGSHILLSTSSGEVDASLGRWGLQGRGALSVAPGQEVEVTGIMKTLLDKPVFVVRAAKVAGRIYSMRNAYGIPVSPQSRERALHNSAQKGESQ